MTKGKLILIPTVIGENTAQETLPSIILNTIKGKGLSLTEGISEWHAKRASNDQLNMMEKELLENFP